MPTIKITGLNTATGRPSTGGTDGTLITDGSMTIGDADTDSIVVNAEFDSDLVPDDTDTYDLGSSTKKWRAAYFEQVKSPLPHTATAKYTESSAVQRYVRWDAAGSNGAPGVNNKLVAPMAGTLITVSIRATSAANSTDIAFHKASNGAANLNTVPAATVNLNMSAANTTYQANFNAPFAAGDILGISLTPANGFGNVNITCVFLFDWS